MANKGTPNGGLKEIAERTYVNGADLTLVAYTNAAGSLGPNTEAADLVQPSVANGYAPILLDGTWSVNDNGVVTYVHSAPTNPTWVASGTWSAPVTGAAIIYGTRVLHFADYAGGAQPWVASATGKLAVDINTIVGG